MNLSQLVRDLQNRLSSILSDPVFKKARNDRSLRAKDPIADALYAYNLALSEEILQLNESSLAGVAGDRTVDEFRKRISSFMESYGTGDKGYDAYVAIISEYLALVAHKPLHPPEVRHVESSPPQDTEHRRYCAWKTRHIKDSLSLCPFCNCLPWPAK